MASEPTTNQTYHCICEAGDGEGHLPVCVLSNQRTSAERAPDADEQDTEPNEVMATLDFLTTKFQTMLELGNPQADEYLRDELLKLSQDQLAHLTDGLVQLDKIILNLAPRLIMLAALKERRT